MIVMNANRHIDKASVGKGLTPEEASLLLKHASPDEWTEIFRVAKKLTEKHFENKVSLFAPLYFSSFCVNDCVYCGFRRSNRTVRRDALKVAEFVAEAKKLWEAGHRQLLLVGGEHRYYADVIHFGPYIWALRDAGMNFSLALEIGPQSEEDYRHLSNLGFERVVLYQETYDRVQYANLHAGGPKEKYDDRYDALRRARNAGFGNVGIGILLGVAEYWNDFLALLRHAYELKETTGQFPSTVSFPRIMKAPGVEFEKHGLFNVSNETYMKLIALTRLALPQAGIVLTTRESALFRNDILRKKIGITHLSAGVTTAPGGYEKNPGNTSDGQFTIADERSLPVMFEHLQQMGYEARVHG